MSQNARKAVAGSERLPPQGAHHIGPVDGHEHLQVTLVLRRRTTPEPVPRAGAPLSRHEHALHHGAAPHDLQAVAAFAAGHGLQLAAHDAAARTVRLSGTAAAMQRAFGVELAHYEQHGRRLRCRSGPVSLPEDVHPCVMAVLGLDDRPAAKPQFRRLPRATGADGSFTPLQVADLYVFPDGGINGAGQTIALIELGGGYSSGDLDTYFQGLGLAGAPAVSVVSVDGGTNQPGGDADGEVMLDLEVAGAIAPGARLVLYFAPNTDQGFHDAIAQAVHDSANQPGILSISWGGPEDSWTAQARDAMNAALQDAASLGVTVTVACGDNGADDGVGDRKLHVDFPASSPWVLSCGGTRLQAGGGAITSERVWNDLPGNAGATGGGVSKYFALPDYQKQAGVPPQPEMQFAGRGVPDVAGDADPATGYQVRVDGQDSVIGGTSAVAPLWAALVARLNQMRGKPLGFANPLLYPLGATAFRDIVIGNNGHYDAGPGWDACTGLGSPNGAALAQALGKSG